PSRRASTGPPHERGGEWITAASWSAASCSASTGPPHERGGEVRMVSTCHAAVSLQRGRRMNAAESVSGDSSPGWDCVASTWPPHERGGELGAEHGAVLLVIASTGPPHERGGEEA